MDPGTHDTARRPWRWGKGPGWSQLLQRLYRLRLSAALLPAAPALLFVLWYTGATVAEHLRHEAGVGEDRPLTAELFQLHLHDHLSRDLRGLTRPQPDRASKLPSLWLTLGTDPLEKLAGEEAVDEGPAAYVDGTLRFGRETYRVKVRYRGQEAWHRSYPQKSWKVRVQDGRLVHGTRTFSLVNTPEPVPFDEQLVLDAAREAGLLTPDWFPIRLLFNEAAMGVYFFVSQPDGDLVRVGNRVPGSLFSGNDAPIDPATGVSDLWGSARYWKKVATADGVPQDDSRELDALLQVIGTSSQREFATFARDHLALEPLALFDAVDVTFGGDRHDYGRNHKLLLDPYTGRFEPIAWDFRGWRHARVLNRVENPLLVRLKELPEYLTLRNREVWRLLHGTCSPEAVRDRADSLVAQLAAEQAADPYWDAYELLPSGSTYFTRMVRPMTAERQQLVLESRLAEFARRAEFLREELSRPGIGWSFRATAEGRVSLEASVDGPAGYRLDRVSAAWPAGCTPTGWQMFADRNLDGALETDGDASLTTVLGPQQSADLDLRIFPGTVLASRGEVHPTRGSVESHPAARSYRLFLEAGGCVPRTVRIRATNLVTLEPADFTIEPSDPPPAEAPPVDCAEPIAGIRLGRASLHPWCFPPVRQAFTRLGPGTMRVDRTLAFGPDDTVVIAPGTTLELGPGASLVVRGQLFAIGTAEAPIRFLPQQDTWGGLAILGPDTAGSVLAHVEFRGGTSPSVPLTVLPGTVNVHGTLGITLAHCRFEANAPPDAVLHAAYTRFLLLDDVEVRRAPGDALDFEFVSGVMRQVTVVGARQEGLDLMGGNIALTDSRLLDCGGNGISAGSGARLGVTRVLVAGSRVGLLAKSGAHVRLDQVLFHEDDVAVNVRVTGEHWPGSSRVAAHRTFAEACGTRLTVEDGPLDRTPKLRHPLAESALSDLRDDVLGLARWTDLEQELARLRGVLP